MMIIATICIFVAGCGLPLFIVLMPLVFDEFTYYSLAVSQINSSNISYYCATSNDMLQKYLDASDPDDLLREEVAELSYYTFLLATVYFLSSMVSKGFLTYSAMRQTNTLRNNFVRSLLSKDIAWYDVNPSTELHSYLNE